MAIGRISGQMLKSNLLRSGTDLAFETNLLVLDVTNSRVGVGTASPARQLHISGTGAVRIPAGTSAQRGTGANGDIRYNSDTGHIEGYNGAWTAMTGGSTLVDADSNTGIDVERAADQNEIHFFTESSGDVAHIRDDGSFEINNLKIADLTISSLTTNGDINITPNGTGKTVIKNLDLSDLDVLNVGDIALDTISSDSGTSFDIVLDDNSATALEIKEGSNAYMTFDTRDTAELITVSQATTIATGKTFTTDTADINGGAIDGTIIGAGSPAAATVTNLTANGAINIDGDGSADNIDGVIIGANLAAAGTFTTATAVSVQTTNIKANDGTAAGSIADSTGVVTIASAVLTTADINGGTVDATNIGVTTAGSGKFTTLESTGNAVIGGNLTVNGTTTTIDSETLTIEDPLLTLAKNNSGGDANTLDQGLLFNRGSLDNVSFIWDESADEFAMAVTAGEAGTTAGNITIDSYAALHAGVTTVTDLETGSISAADGTGAATIANSTGIMTIASSVLTTTDINGGSIDGTTIGGSSPSTATFTDLTANGAINIDGDGSADNIDGVIIGANLAAAGTFTAIVGSSLSVGDGNITNVGDIALDSISADGTDINIAVSDNSATALTVKEGSNVYLTFDTTNTAEVITSAQDFTVATTKTFTTDTADINGGAIDGTIIGAASAAAGTFTTATAANVQTGTVKANDGTAAITIANSTGAVVLTTATKVTGAFEVDGSTFIFNESSADVDFRFEGNGDANLLFGDAGNDRIGIKTATPAYSLDINSTDAIALPSGDDSQRPSASAGIIRFNSENGAYEGCLDGSTYTEFQMAGDTPIISKVSATGDGSTSTFTGFFGSAPASVANVMVFIDNVYQEPTENYSVSSTNITFTSAPHSAARIFAIVGFDNTAAGSGGVLRTETSATNFTSAATTIASFNATSYRSAEMFITTSDSGNTEYEVAKALVVHDGTTAYVTVYGQTSSTGSDLSTYSATLSGGSVLLQAVSAGGQQSARVQYSLSAV